MSVLYLALAIYIVGVALVLYIRPSLMFHPDNGTWKEFGLDSSHRNTIFPFWMFTIVWAFLSYAVASLSNVFVANVVLRSNNVESNIATPISEVAYTQVEPGRQVVHTNESLVAPVARSRAPRMPKIAPPPPVFTPTPEPVQLPGYYIVEPQPSGVPKFVYFGHTPPTFEDLSKEV